MFVPDPASVTSEQERGRAYVVCLCGATYWYAAVDRLNEPISEARVRAASVALTPGSGSLQTDGQPVLPPVIKEIAATDEVAVVITPESGTKSLIPPESETTDQQSLIPTPPPETPVSRIITAWYRLPWYGWYAREAS